MMVYGHGPWVLLFISCFYVDIHVFVDIYASIYIKNASDHASKPEAFENGAPAPAPK